MMMLFCNQQSGITGVCLLREVVDFFFFTRLGRAAEVGDFGFERIRNRFDRGGDVAR